MHKTLLKHTNHLAELHYPFRCDIFVYQTDVCTVCECAHSGYKIAAACVGLTVVEHHAWKLLTVCPKYEFWHYRMNIIG